MWTRMNDIDRMFGALEQMRARMNRVFNDYDGGPGWRLADSGPRTNLYDLGDHFEIRAEVTGIAKEDIGVKIQGNYLEISGSRKSEAPEGYKAHRVEGSANTFTRSFTLPADVDSEKVEASLENGILTLTLPKAEAAKPKQISIH